MKNCNKEVIAVLQIDFDADLNWVDDQNRNIAKVPGAAQRYTPGDVAVAGRPGIWSWAVIDEVDDPWVYFWQVTAEEARGRGKLVVAAK
jgi:hypothetical protein